MLLTSNSINLLSLSTAAQTPEVLRVEYLLHNLQLPITTTQHIKTHAAALITATRTHTPRLGLSLSHLLNIYTLASPQGIALMRLAESLLRIPDKATADALLASILAQGDLVGHLGSGLSALLAKLGLPLARKSISLLGEQFILGKTIAEALKCSVKPYRYSYDMLGEAAKTANDAEDYFQKYSVAIHAIGMQTGPIASPGISVKLSALHPRYQYSQLERLQKELVPKIIELCVLAKQYQIGLTLDAEEADRLQLSLILIKQVLASSELNHWDGLGLAVQAYQKACPEVLDLCAQMARKTGHRLMLRLVKGAYWDSEIKRAQELGLNEYPVYTRKITTDVSYIVCAQKILKHRDEFYPQFATHNAYTIATILQLVQNNREFEFQRLQGMGDALYQTVIAQENVACRVYAPVGDYQHLLAYLVRRLLENGANSSFVHQIEGETPVEQLINDPSIQLAALEVKPHPAIPLPKELYGSLRENSKGIDLSDFVTLAKILPLLSKPARVRTEKSVAPSHALTLADQAFPSWSQQDVQLRANILRKAADLFTDHHIELMQLLVKEGKKTIPDALSEVREAIDYCRYYALEAEKLMQPQTLPGPTGENNELTFQGRGIAVCISPWNFPLAIFLGQIVAALVTGNTVIAKPASQTPQIATRAVELLHQAGVPLEVLQLLIVRGNTMDKAILSDPRVALVVFTGSLETAQQINRTLAAREGAIAAFIAETGGQNAMIVDSSALLEQTVTDIVTSAFNSAGQRCSALRLLCVQKDIDAPLIAMLKGAMAELSLGAPDCLATDVGPVIDKPAQTQLQNYLKKMSASILYQTPLPEDTAKTDTFVTPTLIEIKSINVLTQEIFGPVLHVYAYERNDLPQVIQSINATGYGLTLGVHSRIDTFAKDIVKQTLVGNNYINRNIIGAVVGVQPFGGQRLSGTGPKAGGPHYLTRMVTEKTVTVNTVAIGGNAQLLTL